MEDYTFKFKNKIYQLTDKWEETCVNDAKYFQMIQFNYLLGIKDFITMENRVNNQVLFGYLKEINYIK